MNSVLHKEHYYNLTSIFSDRIVKSLTRKIIHKYEKDEHKNAIISSQVLKQVK
jgi:hypothetical protein